MPTPDDLHDIHVYESKDLRPANDQMEDPT